MAMSASERHGREQILKKFGGERVMTIGRAAVLTANHNGRLACHYCGPCERGCVTHSYFNSIGSTLPAARKTGRLTLRPWSVVAEVLYDAKKGKARGVRVIDAQSMESMEFEAKVVGSDSAADLAVVQQTVAAAAVRALERRARAERPKPDE